MESLKNRARKATEMFLDRRGYEIIDSPWKTEEKSGPIDIVALDEDAIVFVTVKSRKGSDKGFPNETYKREQVEKFAIDWFTAHADEFEDCAFRFDVVSLLVISEHRAMIRHHINAMSIEGIDTKEE